MANLKELRVRIASVKSTAKITKAMQMVAAAKLRRAQEAAEAARPYSKRMSKVLANLAGGGEPADAPKLMTGTGKDDVHLLVVCTAERGLCGGFNSSIARLARDHARRLLANGKTVKFICVGKKGFDILRREFGDKIIDRVDLRSVKRLGFADADAIGKKVIGLFEDGQFDVCTLFYSEFENVVTQTPQAQQIIPAKPEAMSEGDADEAGSDVLYDYEPSEADILRTLIPRNISVQIFRALLENAASEQGARMSAMDNATRNANDMIDRLTLDYNRQRQAKITTELIEIIAGAEAL
ncbi:F0F1 ATP synthase subunit gamma [Notoacmeibacter sp. MSK16QG-6]|uniref:F0F1 ATP synthase subunit gamma n=1 Tax=Notoacmeibacter sp. MSK16QG-6 TaxID=2957982 RepID=UPI00209CDA2B|nr:F0F1 ATP synthase subunit gamma [Notoacmeibacter sp. MSK16QG-6]MCP1200963.1 F0F1 ATP synthase subunit gamma [Notoacmeibacter sp. MSK16QG-6]